MDECIKSTGKILNLNNADIVKYLCEIEEERKTLESIIQKQYQERKKLESEIERLTYKLCLINKSLSMRIKAKNNYDKTIEEIRNHYDQLVDSSNKLKQIVEKTQQELDDIMNKKTGTGPDNEEIKMLYVKSSGDRGADDCPCTYTEIPTKEKPVVQSVNKLPIPFQKSTNSVQIQGDVNEGSIVTPPKGLRDYTNSLSTQPEIQMSPTQDSLPPPQYSSKSDEEPDILESKPSGPPSRQEQMKNSNSRNLESSKNLLLARLRSTERSSEPTSEIVQATGPMHSTIVQERLSDEQKNKLKKKRLDDVFGSMSQQGTESITIEDDVE